MQGCAGGTPGELALPILRLCHVMAIAEPSPQSSSPDAAPRPATRERLGSPWNAPNLVTISRLVLSFAVFGLMASGTLWWLAGLVFIVAVATDALDGYLARKYGMITVLGRVLDPFVDKFIVCGGFLFLVAQPGSGVSVWLALVVLGREMFVTSLRSFLESEGRDFSATASGKIKMVLQCVAVSAATFSLDPWIMASPGATFVFVVREASVWLAGAATIWSGWEYTVRAIRILRG